MSEVKWLDWSFQDLVENSGDIFIGLDDQFKIRYISSSVLELYGAEPMNLLGRDIFDFVDGTMVNAYKSGLTNATGLKPYEVALEFQKGTKIYFDVHLKQDLAHKGFALKLHDVTVKKAKE